MQKPTNKACCILCINSYKHIGKSVKVRTSAKQLCQTKYDMLIDCICFWVKVFFSMLKFCVKDGWQTFNKLYDRGVSDCVDKGSDVIVFCSQHQGPEQVPFVLCQGLKLQSRLHLLQQVMQISLESHDDNVTPVFNFFIILPQRYIYCFLWDTLIKITWMFYLQYDSCIHPLVTLIENLKDSLSSF